jgi:hypothetical protein
MRICAALLLLTLLSAVTVTIHQRTSAVAAGGDWPTYMHDIQRSSSGSTYSAYTSSDGTTWTLLAGSSITLNMNGPILAGLAVTSHNNNALSTVSFDTVRVSTTVP